MINSMTGYGRAQRLINGREITVEVKSVNHRFFEFSARAPRSCGYLEERLKGLVYEKASRGKIDVVVTIQNVDGASARIDINKGIAESYMAALRNLGEELGLEDDITLASISRFSDIFSIRKAEDDESEIWDSVRQTAAAALEKFSQMRASEGERLRRDVLERLETIESCVGKVDILSPAVVEEYRERLSSRLREILSDRQPDEQRVLTEAAIFAEKTAVAEETVRLSSHISQLRDFLSSGGAVGRKLDFLVQECNREANTIGSKCQDIGISRIVVEIKSEIEKIREQIQNIE